MWSVVCLFLALPKTITLEEEDKELGFDLNWDTRKDDTGAAPGVKNIKKGI